MKQTTKGALKHAILPFAPVLRIGLNIAASASFGFGKVVAYSYNKLWSALGVYWYDHNFDYLLGPALNISAERGFFVNRLLPEGGTVLDIACGDGFFSSNYYSRRASHVDAFDYDSKAIALAQRKHSRPNVSFFVADATLHEFPVAHYDVIAMFACIEHFSESDGARILSAIGKSLRSGGVLIGSTPIFSTAGGHNDEHKNEFLSAERLRDFLKPHFATVDLWFSDWPLKIGLTKTIWGRRECYFECRKKFI